MFLVAEMQILPYMATSHAVPNKKGNIHISATRNVLSDVGLIKELPVFQAYNEALQSGARLFLDARDQKQQQHTLPQGSVYLLFRLTLFWCKYVCIHQTQKHAFDQFRIRFQRLPGPTMTI